MRGCRCRGRRGHASAEMDDADGRTPRACAGRRRWTASARTALRDHGWPGNVRELRNRLERALGISAGAPQISFQAIFPEQVLLDRSDERVASLAEARERAERRHIEEAILQTHGEIAKAATLLGISRTTLWEKMRRLGLH